MRIIDADACSALFDAKYKETRQLILDGETHLNNLAEGFKEASDVIFHMPTINPESLKPHGEWIDIYGGKYENPRYACSKCGEKALYTFERNALGNAQSVQALTDYCPNCGTRMKGG